jgi:hypothetical protein
MVRRESGLYRLDVTGGWTKLHDEYVHNMYPPLITAVEIRKKKDRMNGARSTHGGDEKWLQELNIENPRVLDLCGRTRKVMFTFVNRG